MGHLPMSRHERSLCVWALSCALASNACLPEDTRAIPGSLEVTVTADAASSDGFTTADGWSVTYQRFLVVAGEIELIGGDCDQYAENEYSRVFDATRPGPQRSGLFYGLGACDFAFRVSSPSSDTLAGAGVSEADVIALRTPGSDAHANEAGASISVEGSAEKLGQLKRFQWAFRRFIQYEKCSLVTPEQATERGVTLRAGAPALIDLAVLGETFFLEDTGGSTPVVAFEPFRAADDAYGDADGTITLGELQRAPWHGPPDPDGREWATLGDRVYLGLLQHVLRFRGSGTCVTRASPREPDDGGPF